MTYVFLLWLCKQITSSLAGAIPSVFPKGFRPLEADISKANAKFKKKKRLKPYICRNAAPMRINR